MDQNGTQEDYEVVDYNQEVEVSRNLQFGALASQYDSHNYEEGSPRL